MLLLANFLHDLVLMLMQLMFLVSLLLLVLRYVAFTKWLPTTRNINRLLDGCVLEVAYAWTCYWHNLMTTRGGDLSGSVS